MLRLFRAHNTRQLGVVPQMNRAGTQQHMVTKHIDRRQFLVSVATAAGVIVPSVGSSAGRPCPPPSLGVLGGTTVNTSCNRAVDGRLPRLTLTSRAADGLHAWTFGQAFRMGHVPSGSTVTADDGPIQVDVRNRWPDGSLKFAVLSGITRLARDTPKSISLLKSTAGADPGPQHVPEPASLDVLPAPVRARGEQGELGWPVGSRPRPQDHGADHVGVSLLRPDVG